MSTKAKKTEKLASQLSERQNKKIKRDYEDNSHKFVGSEMADAMRHDLLLLEGHIHDSDAE